MKEAADPIDQLISVDANKQEVIDDLFVAAFEHHEQSPSVLAARELAEEVEPGDIVGIATGFILPPTGIQETDGPVGAASLAHAVSAGLDAHPVIFCEQEAVASVSASARALGLNVLDGVQPTDAPWTCSVSEFPKDRGEAKREAKTVVSEYDPSALMAVEKCGENELGEYHTATGINITDSTSKTGELFRESDALSIGIGDIGNELGMGTLEETIRTHVPNANECGCECGGGVTADFAADIVVPATVSNWGAHGIAAALSREVDEAVLHDPELEERALLESSRVGAIDATGRTDGWCDFLSPEIHAGVVRMLHQLI